MKRQMEQWITWGKQQKRQLFFYEDRVFDLTTFCLIHPGGKKAIIKYVYKDISKILFNIYPHSSNCLQTLSHYRIGINTSFTKSASHNDKSPNKSAVESYQKTRKVCFRKTIEYSEDKKKNNMDKSHKSSQKSPKKLHQKTSQSTAANSKTIKMSETSEKFIQDTSLSQNQTRVEQLRIQRLICWEENTDIQEQQQGIDLMIIPIFKVKHLNQI